MARSTEAGLAYVTRPSPFASPASLRYTFVLFTAPYWENTSSDQFPYPKNRVRPVSQIQLWVPSRFRHVRTRRSVKRSKRRQRKQQNRARGRKGFELLTRETSRTGEKRSLPVEHVYVSSSRGRTHGGALMAVTDALGPRAPATTKGASTPLSAMTINLLIVMTPNGWAVPTFQSEQNKFNDLRRILRQEREGGATTLAQQSRAGCPPADTLLNQHLRHIYCFCCSPIFA